MLSVGGEAGPVMRRDGCGDQRRTSDRGRPTAVSQGPGGTSLEKSPPAVYPSVLLTPHSIIVGLGLVMLLFPVRIW